MDVFDVTFRGSQSNLKYATGLRIYGVRKWSCISHFIRDYGCPLFMHVITILSSRPARDLLPDLLTSLQVNPSDRLFSSHDGQKEQRHLSDSSVGYMNQELRENEVIRQTTSCIPLQRRFHASRSTLPLYSALITKRR